MLSADEDQQCVSGSQASTRFYYGWVNVVLGSLAMTATLPGRTHGLALIATPLAADLEISAQTFSVFNFWAILLGSAACLPVGRAIDRFGTRIIGTLVLAALAAAVVAMSRTPSVTMLFVALVCVRGLGQSALSVVSLAIVGKWFTRRPGPAMSVFAVLLTIGFATCFVIIPPAVAESGWRDVWRNVGVSILGCAVVTALFVRSNPPSHEQDRSTPPRIDGPPNDDATLAAALRTPVFWIFSLACAYFNLVSSAVTLHNQDILATHGYDVHVFGTVMAVSAGTGLLANFLGGWLLNRWSPNRLLALGIGFLAMDLAIFPFANASDSFGLSAIILYAVLMGISGGIITVVFFAFYSHAFGRTHLGRIQAVAQFLTVLASAIGPVVLTSGANWLSSFDPMFVGGALIALLFALAAMKTAAPAMGRPTI